MIKPGDLFITTMKLWSVTTCAFTQQGSIGTLLGVRKVKNDTYYFTVSCDGQVFDWKFFNISEFNDCVEKP